MTGDGQNETNDDATIKIETVLQSASLLSRLVSRPSYVGARGLVISARAPSRLVSPLSNETNADATG